jgi:hypothetical protein
LLLHSPELCRVDTSKWHRLTSNHYGIRLIRLIGELDERLRLFLHDSVKSYEQLETLLFLAKNEGQSFSAEAITLALSAAAGSIDEALEELTSVGGLIDVVRSPSAPLYHYAPRDASIRQRVGELAAYAERRMTVMQMLSANALERVRHAAMRRLADAFRLERGKK